VLYVPAHWHQAHLSIGDTVAIGGEQNALVAKKHLQGNVVDQVETELEASPHLARLHTALARSSEIQAGNKAIPHLKKALAIEPLNLELRRLIVAELMAQTGKHATPAQQQATHAQVVAEVAEWQQTLAAKVSVCC
jgi:hypothetical protein